MAMASTGTALSNRTTRPKKPMPVEPLEHLRAAYLDLPGETWDVLLLANGGNPGTLERALGGACEVFDSERGRIVLNLSNFLENKQRAGKSLAALNLHAEQARDLDYDFLMISF